ncbi:MAG: right-handed parallel beta-helix repeat-containing protein, partial [Cytophagaceae bacterium]|nr:right-handed parallel beta-helix repeat-containing protein [Cytophagaceae bacterium]
MKKLSFIITLFLSAALSFTSCQKKENEIQPASGNDMSVKLEGITYAYIIKPTESEVDGSKLNLAPGSVVCIESGTRGPLYLKNFTGTETNPITFINGSSGQTIIKGNSGGPWAVKVGYSKNIRITGTGSSSKYGIVMEGGQNSFTLPELTTNYEIDHVEVRNAGFAGIMAKTDPNCDSKTWRDNFVMRNVSLHDNYVHDVKGEGFYVGNSFYNGKSESCGTVYPHTIEGLKIYKNIVNNTGAEGIQVGCAVKDCEIYDNSIENPGRDPFAAYQNNGLQIGAGTGGKCYNNIIKNAPGNGMIVNGIGGNLVYNNLIVNSGALGIFCDERTEPKEGFTFINNTIVNSGTDGMRFYSELVPMNNIINNIIINPKSGKYINAASGVKLNSQNNYTSMDVASVKFAGSDNYTLASGSPAINAGANVSSYGVVKDLMNNLRPAGGAYDIGAYESGASGGSSSSSPTPTPTPTPSPTPTPTPTPTPSTGQSVVSLTLVNADTEKDIALLTNGYIIDFAKIGTKN